MPERRGARRLTGGEERTSSVEIVPPLSVSIVRKTRETSLPSFLLMDLPRHEPTIFIARISSVSLSSVQPCLICCCQYLRQSFSESSPSCQTSAMNFWRLSNWREGSAGRVSLHADAVEHAARVRLGSIALRASVRGASQLQSYAACEDEGARARAPCPGLRARAGRPGLLLEETARLLHVNCAAFVGVELVEHLSNLRQCADATRTVHARGGREHAGRTSFSNLGESSGSWSPRHLMTGAIHPMLTGGRSISRGVRACRSAWIQLLRQTSPTSYET